MDKDKLAKKCQSNIEKNLKVGDKVEVCFYLDCAYLERDAKDIVNLLGEVEEIEKGREIYVRINSLGVNPGLLPVILKVAQNSFSRCLMHFDWSTKEKCTHRRFIVDKIT